MVCKERSEKLDWNGRGLGTAVLLSRRGREVAKVMIAVLAD